MGDGRRLESTKQKQDRRRLRVLQKKRRGEAWRWGCGTAPRDVLPCGCRPERAPSPLWMLANARLSEEGSSRLGLSEHGCCVQCVPVRAVQQCVPLFFRTVLCRARGACLRLQNKIQYNDVLSAFVYHSSLIRRVVTRDSTHLGPCLPRTHPVRCIRDTALQ